MPDRLGRISKWQLIQERKSHYETGSNEKVLKDDYDTGSFHNDRFHGGARSLEDLSVHLQEFSERIRQLESELASANAAALASNNEVLRLQQDSN